jgi:acetyl-CoA carboxylase carboxyltransferase component
MVKGTSFMGLGGPNLVKGATGETVDSETLGGASTHTEISGVAHYALENDEECLAKLRDLVARLPGGRGPSIEEGDPYAVRFKSSVPSPPKRSSRKSAKSPASTSGASDDLYDLLPADHRMSYDMHPILAAILDNGAIDEFQADLAREIICGDGAIDGIPIGVIGKNRVFHRSVRQAEDPAALCSGCLRLHGGA